MIKITPEDYRALAILISNHSHIELEEDYYKQFLVYPADSAEEI